MLQVTSYGKINSPGQIELNQFASPNWSYNFWFGSICVTDCRQILILNRVACHL